MTNVSKFTLNEKYKLKLNRRQYLPEGRLDSITIYNNLGRMSWK